LLLIDGLEAFAGGMNIGDRQLTQGPSKNRASDLHFHLRGPVVDELRGLFVDDWELAGGGPLSVPTASPIGEHNLATPLTECRVIADGPDEQLNHLALLIEGVVSAAQQHITVVTPYFLPEKSLIGALCAAALRGVQVTIVIPRTNNWPFVRWALGHNLWELLSAGVVVVEQPAPFAHTKCLVIDDNYALIGSANLDARSLRLNFELGIEIFGSEFCATLTNHIDSISRKSTRLAKESIRNRNLGIRLRDALAALFAPYL
jgi:cardiolipin synthase